MPWKGKRVKLNLADYDQAQHGPILESLTVRR
jgi:hypothetical protein